jgi:hypothetical protein
MEVGRSRCERINPSSPRAAWGQEQKATTITWKSRSLDELGIVYDSLIKAEEIRMVDY